MWVIWISGEINGLPAYEDGTYVSQTKPKVIIKQHVAAASVSTANQTNSEYFVGVVMSKNYEKNNNLR